VSLFCEFEYVRYAVMLEWITFTEFNIQLECGPKPNVMAALFNAAKFG